MRAFLLGLALVLAASTARATAMFVGLGTLPGYVYSVAAGVSADGSIVAGSATAIAGDERAFTWSAGTGMGALALLPGSSFTEAGAISANGSVVVGQAFPPGGAVRWTPAGVSSLGIPGIAYGVSSDGSVIVGERYEVGAFRWTSDTGATSLGSLPGDGYSIAYGVSADGSTVVGNSFAGDTGVPEAFLWTAAGGMVSIVTLPGVLSSEASAVTPDGSVVVGFAGGATFEQAFRWTASGGMVLLGLPAGVSDGFTSAYAVSADGSVIVGGGVDYVAGRPVAFIWDAAHGARSLKDVLEFDYGLDLTGWTLDTATGISADGRTVVGWGISPSLEQEAWIAFLPEPSTALLIAIGLAGLAGWRRRFA